jgi:hypothetical protein
MHLAYFSQLARELDLVNVPIVGTKISLVQLSWVTIWAGIWVTSFTAQVWVYSRRALTKPSGLQDLLVGHISHEVCARALEHLTIVGLLVCFIRPLRSLDDKYPTEVSVNWIGSV